MAIPKYQAIMLPLLTIAGDGKEHSIRDLIVQLAPRFNLSEQELNEIVPSGLHTIFYDRVSWARGYLTKAGLLESTRRRYYQITSRGKEVLEQKPTTIDVEFLRKFPEFNNFEKAGGAKKPKVAKAKLSEEILEDAYQKIQDDLARKVLVRLNSCSPRFFEQLVVKLLVKMGYGGSQRDVAHAIGLREDGSIDGLISEDRLGFDMIYIQAKKWGVLSGLTDLQKFVDTLVGKRAKKGAFITTSHFSLEAIKYAAEIDTKIILIDGKRFADLMIEYNIGVMEGRSYQIKRLDLDFFFHEPLL